MEKLLAGIWLCSWGVRFLSLVAWLTMHHFKEAPLNGGPNKQMHQQSYLSQRFNISQRLEL